MFDAQKCKASNVWANEGAINIQKSAIDRLVSIPYLEKEIEACVTTLPGTRKSDYGLMLTHGAGGDMHLNQLKLLAECLAAQGITVVRFTCKGLNIVYRTKVYKHVLEYVCAQFKDMKSWILAGRSMGARAAVIAANNIKRTQLHNSVAGVLALSYPLHTKDNKSNLRDGPLYELNKPVCFISGAEDEMCDETLFKDVLRKVNNYTITWLPGADHSLKIKGIAEEDVVAKIGTLIVAWCSHSLNGDMKRCDEAAVNNEKEAVTVTEHKPHDITEKKNSKRTVKTNCDVRSRKRRKITGKQ